MPTQEIVNVFVASPGDLGNERKRLRQVVDRLNYLLGDLLGVQIKPREWREVAPNMGRPEDVILDQTKVTSWDVFVGLLWLRFGMPPGKDREGKDYDSGTEEEFRLAYRAWCERARPRILFYRCRRPAPTSLDTEQLGKVQRFFDEFAPTGKNPGLFQDFGQADEFARLVEKDLVGLLFEKYQNRGIAVTPGAETLPPVLAHLKQKVEMLGDEDCRLHSFCGQGNFGGVGTSAALLPARGSEAVLRFWADIDGS